MTAYATPVARRPTPALPSMIEAIAFRHGWNLQPLMAAKQRSAIPQRTLWANKAESGMWEFFYRTGPKEGLKVRAGQIDMAEEVLEAIKGKHHLVTEAGVGIGKSYGYLVPVLLYHKESHEPVVIATSTIALQEQLAGDIDKLLVMLGINEKAIVAKGQANYLCRQRENSAFFKHRDEIDGIEAIHSCAFSGCNERRDFPMEIPEATWKQLCIARYNKRECEGGCPFSAQCEYHRMRERILNAGIVICNQDMLTAHLMHMKAGTAPVLNPNIGIVVVDEAHNLETRVRSMDTRQISAAKVKQMLSNAVNSMKSRTFGFMDECGLAVRTTADALFGNIQTQVLRQMEQGVDSQDAERFFFEDTDGAYKLVKELADAVLKAANIYTMLEAHSRYVKSTQQIRDLQAVGTELFNLAKSLSQYLFWVEVDRGELVLAYCRKDTSQLIRSLYFDRNHMTILTSATMAGRSDGTLEQQYGYFIRNTGFPMKSYPGFISGKLTESIPSPFPYNQHAMIYHADDLPHPTKEHEKFIKEGAKRLKEILDISEGRALVLFTSKTDMRDIAAELRRQKTPYRVLVQRESASQADVIRQFKEDEHAVLMGTGSFWEGISIEGRTLSNVVIFRLPFPVPDPVSMSRERDVIDPLMEVRVPDMIIKLKQGVGRLIRNETDKGIISILDSRLSEESTAPYKNQVWNALPIKNRTESLEVIRDFYRNTVIGEKMEVSA